MARVEHRERQRDGSWVIGVAMNRSQCATTKPDHAVDPILVPHGHRSPRGDRSPNRPDPMEGYLMGAQCTESDLLSRRQLRFPHGVARGDLVAFPNTAGYLMHFVETRSHQFALARNVVVGAGGPATVTPGPIDEFG